MMNVLFALGIFLVAHVVPTRGGLRGRLVAALGERGYLLAYSLVSIGLLVWVVLAARQAPYVELWPAYAWTHWTALLVMPFSMVLVVTGAISPNPLSVAFRRADFPPDRPGILAVTRHPILWGFALWSGVHLLANGDLVWVVLFAGLTLFALAGMARMDRKRRDQLGLDAWRARAGPTSLVPFAAIIAGRARIPTDPRTALGALLGLAVYAGLLLGLHLALFGADPLSGT
jgi:uncharacterized membrane protein